MRSSRSRGIGPRAATFPEPRSLFPTNREPTPLRRPRRHPTAVGVRTLVHVGQNSEPSRSRHALPKLSLDGPPARYFTSLWIASGAPSPPGPLTSWCSLGHHAAEARYAMPATSRRRLLTREAGTTWLFRPHATPWNSVGRRVVCVGGGAVFADGGRHRPACRANNRHAVELRPRRVVPSISSTPIRGSPSTSRPRWRHGPRARCMWI